MNQQKQSIMMEEESMISQSSKKPEKVSSVIQSLLNQTAQGDVRPSILY
jgi:hypothetical protein